jgi:aryl-alcohol dehydrogenase-like predicted oxidoreductase
MEMRRLGRQGLGVSAIGLGCAGLTAEHVEPDAGNCAALLREAAELGVTLLDSSDAYGNGKNEELIGAAIAGMRERFVVATKFGNIRGPNGERGAGFNGHPDYVPQACDASLKRLGIDAIDLYYLHRVDPKVPIEDTVGAMARLVEAGKVRHIGLCEAGARTLERAHATYPLAALQTEYSLWSRDVETEILPIVQRLGIGFVAYAPLGRGFLTGALTSRGDLAAADRRNAHPRFQPGNFEANQHLLLALDRLSAEHGCSKAQLALAWVLAQGADIVPIPGTRQPRYLQQNVGALAVSLSAAELGLLSQAFPPGAAAGTRYPEAQMKSMGI